MLFSYDVNRNSTFTSIHIRIHLFRDASHIVFDHAVLKINFPVHILTLLLLSVKVLSVPMTGMIEKRIRKFIKVRILELYYVFINYTCILNTVMFHN